MLSSSPQSPTATAISEQSPINKKKITAEAAQGNIMTEQSPATKSKVAAKEDASMTPRTSMQAPRASPAQTPIDFIRKTVAAAAQENIRNVHTDFTDVFRNGVTSKAVARANYEHGGYEQGGEGR